MNATITCAPVRLVLQVHRLGWQHHTALGLLQEISQGSVRDRSKQHKNNRSMLDCR